MVVVQYVVRHEQEQIWIQYSTYSNGRQFQKTLSKWQVKDTRERRTFHKFKLRACQVGWYFYVANEGKPGEYMPEIAIIAPKSMQAPTSRRYMRHAQSVTFFGFSFSLRSRH